MVVEEIEIPVRDGIISYPGYFINKKGKTRIVRQDSVGYREFGLDFAHDRMYPGQLRLSTCKTPHRWCQARLGDPGLVGQAAATDLAGRADHFAGRLRLLPSPRAALVRAPRCELHRRPGMQFADRTSAHQWWTHQFRLLLSSLACVLMETIRRLALHDTELAHAQVGTLRLKLLKIGAIILRNTRRIRFLLSSAFPCQNLFYAAARRLVPG